MCVIYCKRFWDYFFYHFTFVSCEFHTETVFYMEIHVKLSTSTNISIVNLSSGFHYDFIIHTLILRTSQLQTVICDCIHEVTHRIVNSNL